MIVNALKKPLLPKNVQPRGGLLHHHFSYNRSVKEWVSNLIWDPVLLVKLFYRSYLEPHCPQLCSCSRNKTMLAQRVVAYPAQESCLCRKRFTRLRS